MAANPNIPGVIVYENDQSTITRANVSTNFAMIGAFERGSDDTPFLVSGGEAQFLKLCGSVNNAVDKIAFVSAIQMLRYAQGIWMINVTKNAKFGGISVREDGASSFVSGKTAFTYAFGIAATQTLPLSLTGTLVGPFTGTLTNTRVQPGSVAITFTDASLVVHTGVDNGLGNFTDAKILTGTVNYETGAVSLTFTENCTLVEVTAYKTDEAFAIFANSKKAWSNNYGVKIIDANRYTELISTGTGSQSSFSIAALNNLPIKKKSAILTFVSGGVTVNVTDDGAGNFTNATYLTGTNTINYVTGAITLTFVTVPAPKVPDAGTNISIAYTLDDGFFYIQEYQKLSDGTTSLITSWLVSQDPYAVDPNTGKSAYIEDVINDVSLNFKVINNTAYLGQIPQVTTIVYCGGGDNGITPTSVEKAAALTLISNNQQIDFSTFVGCGTQNIGSANYTDVINLCNAKGAVGILDLTAPTDVSVLAQDVSEKKLVWYAQSAYQTYNGKSYLVPMSAMDAANFAQSIALTGQYYMPPNGINRGSLQVTKMDRYYTDPEIEILQNKKVNVVKYFKTYGNVIFSNMTSQKKLSATSYRNSVLTLNDMIKTFNESLLVVDFDVINSSTFRRLRTTIETYLDRLAKYDGTIEPDYTLNIETLNNAATKDEKKIYAELIFVFQSLAEQVIFTLTYTSNQLYLEIK